MTTGLAHLKHPCMHVRRACTDNDRGGTKGSSYAARWIDAGLDRMERAGAMDGDCSQYT